MEKENKSEEALHDDPEILKKYDHLIHVDNDKLRKHLTKAKFPSAAYLAKYAKSVIGADISRISMPVILNEPCTILQKTAEYSYCHNIFGQVADKDDSLLRMAYVVSGIIASQ